MKSKLKTVLVTGSEGFIAKNLILKLNELSEYRVLEFNRKSNPNLISKLINESDAVIHLAGENRPKNENDFKRSNIDLTRTICNEILNKDVKTSLVFSSSIQAKLDNTYGKSKLEAEKIIYSTFSNDDNPVSVFRFPGVFGKWCKPNYNSVVATFCHNIANDIGIKISDPSKIISIVYIDDVVKALIDSISANTGINKKKIHPEYEISLGKLAEQITSFGNVRKNLISEQVGSGFVRALYSTYVSYLPKEKFIYPLVNHADERGSFVEMLKTKSSGQFSFFTAHPGVVRGGHYHHTKTEKFLVIKGDAKFRFKNIDTNDYHEIKISGEKPTIVETIPGWTHDITNIGNDELIVMLWANEIFDKENPDTISSGINNE